MLCMREQRVTCIRKAQMTAMSPMLTSTLSLVNSTPITSITCWTLAGHEAAQTKTQDPTISTYPKIAPTMGPFSYALPLKPFGEGRTIHKRALPRQLTCTIQSSHGQLCLKRWCTSSRDWDSLATILSCSGLLTPAMK